MENNYQLSRIHNYVNGLMTKDDMYALEREALEDPFLQDAIDGYKLQNGVDIKQLSLLQQRLATRVKEQSNNRNKRFYNWQRLAIGMTAGVMFITVCSLLLIKYIPQKKSVDIKEVIITDAVFEYEAVPVQAENNVVPVKGWGALYEVLNVHYSNSQHYVGALDIHFDVDSNNKAYNIVIEGNNFQKDEELEDLLRNKLQWKGGRAHFKLDMYKIDL